MDRAVSGPSFLTRGVFECDLAHSASVAVLLMLYNIRCNPLYPLYVVLPVPVLVTRCATLMRIDLCDPVFDGVRLVGFKSEANEFLLA